MAPRRALKQLRLKSEQPKSILAPPAALRTTPFSTLVLGDGLLAISSMAQQQRDRPQLLCPCCTWIVRACQRAVRAPGGSHGYAKVLEVGGCGLQHREREVTPSDREPTPGGMVGNRRGSRKGGGRVRGEGERGGGWREHTSGVGEVELEMQEVR